MILKRTIITLAVLIVIVFVIGYVFSANNAIKSLDNENSDILSRLEKAEQNVKTEETKLNNLKIIAINSRTDIPMIRDAFDVVLQSIQDTQTILDNEDKNGKTIFLNLSKQMQDLISTKKVLAESILNKWQKKIVGNDASVLSMTDMTSFVTDLNKVISYINEVKSSIAGLKQSSNLNSALVNSYIKELENIVSKIEGQMASITNIVEDQNWEKNNDVLSSYNDRGTVSAYNPSGIVVTTADILNQEKVVEEAKKQVEIIQNEINNTNSSNPNQSQSQNQNTETGSNIQIINSSNNSSYIAPKDPSLGDVSLPPNLSPYKPKYYDPSKPRLLQGMNPEY
jgi:hypothetical protein